MDHDVIAQIEILIEREKLDMALQRIQLALADYPDSASLYLLMSEVLHRKDKLKEALGAIEHSIGLDAESDWAFFKKAQIHMELRDWKSAEKAVDTALEMDPNDPNYYAFKGHLCVLRERYKEAVDWAQRGLDLNPDHNYSNNIKSMAHNSMGESRSAFEHLEYMLERDPENATTQANLGYHYLRANDIKQAKQHFAEALRINPTLEFARNGMQEAIKASNWSYRQFLQFTFLMERIGSRNRWALLIGLVLVFQFLPMLAPIYLVFVLWTWFSGPISDIFLVFDRYGKYLMTDRHRWTAYGLTALAAGSLASVVLGFVVSPPFFTLALALFLAMVPLFRLESSETRIAQAIQGTFLLVLFVLAAYGLLPMEGAERATGWIILAAVLYSWAANIGNSA